MNQAGGFPLLTLILAVNGLGALTIWLVPARRVDTWRWLAFLVAAAIFFISLFLYMGWSNDPETTLQFVEGPVSWLSILGFQYHLGIDGINLHLIMLIAFSMPMILLSLWKQENKAYVAWLLTCETGLLGALMALDFFWFVLLASSALLAGAFVPGSDPRLGEKSAVLSTRVAITRYLPMTGITVVLLLVAVGSKAWASSLWWAQTLQFWAVMAAMGMVSIGFPYRSGQIAARQPLSPSTYTLVTGLFGTLGVYGMLRFGMLALPLATESFGPAIMLIGLFIAGWNALAMIGTKEYDVGLSRWAICQVGLDMIGLFATSQLGLLGVILRLIGRTLGLEVLFFQAQTQRQRLEQVLLVGGVLTALGVPGLAGFPGLSAWWMALLRWHWQANVPSWVNQAFDWGFYAALALIWLLAGWALIRLWHSLPQNDAPFDRTRQIVIGVLLLSVIVLLGLRPQPFIGATGPTLHNTLKQFNLELQEMLEKLAPVPENQNQMSAIGHAVQVGWLCLH